MLLLHTLLLILAATVPLTAHGQSYPSRPIRIIIPFPPGNTLDTMTRLIIPKLSERLGQNVIVDNRTGASGMLGLQLGADAPRDGYTLVGGQGGTLIVAPQTYKNVPYDSIRDFAPIALSTTNYMGLVIHPRVPFKSMQDLIAYAKANPGKLSFGTGGQFTVPHLAIELLRIKTGFTYLQVPYRGTTEAVTALMGGQIDAVVSSMANLATYVQSNKLRVLAVTSLTRAPQFPNVPAISETVPGYESSAGWFGYLAPAGTPPDIVRLLNREINRTMVLPDVKEKLNSIGLTVVTESPEYFAQQIKSDYEKVGKLIRDMGFHAQ
jgi:tripartite-type tricarboxylate transporter receptor subunit TctC